jgi:hypothetical protein
MAVAPRRCAFISRTNIEEELRGQGVWPLYGAVEKLTDNRPSTVVL